jgi:hypothetical protein
VRKNPGFGRGFYVWLPFAKFYNLQVTDFFPIDYKPKHGPHLMKAVFATGPRVHVQKPQFFVVHYF